ncbi:Ubiquitin-related modifier 1 [Elasticomyces elasticus]|nr:Ubiquitin-related modifier 1 [Elasticomyces elasticus]KAK3645343.1 Ubiquitin-related modifier 1 [Elasticomyces elasticus]KAK4919816.1 Ubiquitin-related modifier 1 [Elasticomyces elasticus]KAK5750114.1 Ubiquitin-related modifier 1 [Elasticomyces elasticus]
MTEAKAASIPLAVEFTGGLELLFSNQRKHKIAIPSKKPDGEPSNVGDLISWLCDNLIKDPRKEMFVLDDSVRPGILVLINDADWELEGEDKYELQPNDEIVFVSTLHGG